MTRWASTPMDRTQVLLFYPTLEAMIPEDHPVRLFEDIECVRLVELGGRVLFGCGSAADSPQDAGGGDPVRVKLADSFQPGFGADVRQFHRLHVVYRFSEIGTSIN